MYWTCKTTKDLSTGVNRERVRERERERERERGTVINDKENLETRGTMNDAQLARGDCFNDSRQKEVEFLVLSNTLAAG